MPEKYNGWANHDTWNTALWLSNDCHAYEQMGAFFKYGKIQATRETAEHFFNLVFPDGTGDECDSNQINWQEIAESINDITGGIDNG